MLFNGNHMWSQTMFFFFNLAFLKDYEGSPHRENNLQTSPLERDGWL